MVNYTYFILAGLYLVYSLFNYFKGKSFTGRPPYFVYRVQNKISFFFSIIVNLLVVLVVVLLGFHQIGLF